MKKVKQRFYSVTSDVLLVLGCIAVAHGASMFHPALGYIIGGLAAIALGVLFAFSVGGGD